MTISKNRFIIGVLFILAVIAFGQVAWGFTYEGLRRAIVYENYIYSSSLNYFVRYDILTGTSETHVFPATVLGASMAVYNPDSIRIINYGQTAVSGDAGQTWDVESSGFSDVLGMTQPPEQRQTIYYWNTTSLARSDDFGVIWDTLTTDWWGEPIDMDSYFLLTVPGAPEHLYWSVKGGYTGFASLSRSQDGGSTWEGMGTPLQLMPVMDIAFNHSDENTYWVCSGGSLYRRHYPDAYELISDGGSGNLNVVVCDSLRPEIVYAGVAEGPSGEGGLLVSYNSGIDFHTVDFSVPVNEGRDHDLVLYDYPDSNVIYYVSGTSSDIFKYVDHFLCGDVNYDKTVNILDILMFIKYKFSHEIDPGFGFYPPIWDVDGDGLINVLDVMYLINYKFKDGPAPVCGG